MSTVIEEWGLCCPNCGRDDMINITIKTTFEVRLTPHGTDGDPLDHEWDDDSDCTCSACNHSGKISDFSTEG